MKVSLRVWLTSLRLEVSTVSTSLQVRKPRHNKSLQTPDDSAVLYLQTWEELCELGEQRQEHKADEVGLRGRSGHLVPVHEGGHRETFEFLCVALWTKWKIKDLMDQHSTSRNQDWRESNLELWSDVGLSIKRGHLWTGLFKYQF